MKGNNIETEFINFIIDKYSPNTGATASNDDDQRSFNNEDGDEDEAVNFLNRKTSVKKGFLEKREVDRIRELKLEEDNY